MRKSGACFRENVAGSLEGHIPEEGTRERARELAGILTRYALNSHCRLHIAERATNLDQHEERSILWLSGSCLSQLGRPISASTTHLPTSFEDNDDILHYWTIILRFDITSAFLIALL